MKGDAEANIGDDETKKAEVYSPPSAADRKQLNSAQTKSERYQSKKKELLLVYDRTLAPRLNKPRKADSRPTSSTLSNKSSSVSSDRQAERRGRIVLAPTRCREPFCDPGFTGSSEDDSDLNEDMMENRETVPASHLQRKTRQTPRGSIDRTNLSRSLNDSPHPDQTEKTGSQGPREYDQDLFLAQEKSSVGRNRTAVCSYMLDNDEESYDQTEADCLNLNSTSPTPIQREVRPETRSKHNDSSSSKPAASFQLSLHREHEKWQILQTDGRSQAQNKQLMAPQQLEEKNLDSAQQNLDFMSHSLVVFNRKKSQMEEKIMSKIAPMKKKCLDNVRETFRQTRSPQIDELSQAPSSKASVKSEGLYRRKHKTAAKSEDSRLSQCPVTTPQKTGSRHPKRPSGIRSQKSGKMIVLQQTVENLSVVGAQVSAPGTAQGGKRGPHCSKLVFEDGSLQDLVFLGAQIKRPSTTPVSLLQRCRVEADAGDKLTQLMEQLQQVHIHLNRGHVSASGDKMARCERAGGRAAPSLPRAASRTSNKGLENRSIYSSAKYCSGLEDESA